MLSPVSGCSTVVGGNKVWSACARNVEGNEPTDNSRGHNWHGAALDRVVRGTGLGVWEQENDEVWEVILLELFLLSAVAAELGV